MEPSASFAPCRGWQICYTDPGLAPWAILLRPPGFGNIFWVAAMPLCGACNLACSRFSGGSFGHARVFDPRKRRLKAGGSQDWLPHSQVHTRYSARRRPLVFLQEGLHAVLLRRLPGDAQVDALQRLRQIARCAGVLVHLRPEKRLQFPPGCGVTERPAGEGQEGAHIVPEDAGMVFHDLVEVRLDKLERHLARVGVALARGEQQGKSDRKSTRL